MKIFNKQTIALLICVITINILCITSVSFAYFSAKIEGNEKAEDMTVISGSMKISYVDSSEITINDFIPGDSITKEFRVENSGTLDTKYNVKLNIDNNTFTNKDDLRVTLRKKTGMGSYSTVINNAAIPAETGYILVNQELTSETDTYELVITFNSSAVNQQEEEVKQTVNLNVSVDSEQDAQLAPGYNI